MLFGIKEIPLCFENWINFDSENNLYKAKNKKAEIIMKTYLITLNKLLENI
jgi:hypothetical protein